MAEEKAKDTTKDTTKQTRTPKETKPTKSEPLVHVNDYISQLNAINRDRTGEDKLDYPHREGFRGYMKAKGKSYLPEYDDFTPYLKDYLNE